MLQISELHQLLAFAVAALFIVLVPGPNMTYLISCAASQGRRSAILGLLGSNTALITLGVLTGLGLNTLLQAVPSIYYALKIVGSFYFLWLAFKIVRPAENVNQASEIKVNEQKTSTFKTGFLTNVLNPKALVFYVAIFPQFLNPGLGYIALQATILALIHVCISFSVNIVIIFSVSKLANHFNNNNSIRAISKWGIATVFTAFAIRILM